MARKVDLLPRAKRDLERLREWLRQPGAGPKAAREFSEVRDAVRILRQQPVTPPRSAIPGFREKVIHGCKILYRVDPDTHRNTDAGDVLVARIRLPFEDEPDSL